MALRKQPYLPLYIQDFMTDEKLAECSAESVGVYIYMMCLMHKSDDYGKILLKQKYKQTFDQISQQPKEQMEKQNLIICFRLASQIVKHLPFDLNIIFLSICELISEGVLHLDGNCIYQKRMVRDAEISDKRALAGKNGGKKTQKNNTKKGVVVASNFAKANIQANTENEIEYKNVLKLPNDLEDNGGDKIESGNEKFLTAEMEKIYFQKNPEDFHDENFDKKNCWQIATKIEKAKGWDAQSSLNGKQADLLAEWESLLEFSTTHKFYGTFSLKNLESQFSAVWKAYNSVQKKSFNSKTLDVHDEKNYNPQNYGVEYLENFTKVRLKEGQIFELGEDQSWDAKNGVPPKNIVCGIEKH